jgi:hypothetical protein
VIDADDPTPKGASDTTRALNITLRAPSPPRAPMVVGRSVQSKTSERDICTTKVWQQMAH